MLFILLNVFIQAIVLSDLLISLGNLKYILIGILLGVPYFYLRNLFLVDLLHIKPFDKIPSL